MSYVDAFQIEIKILLKPERVNGKREYREYPKVYFKPQDPVANTQVFGDKLTRYR